MVQEDPEIEKMIPTGWCDLCKFRTHAQVESSISYAYWSHKRKTGHDAWGQRKFVMNGVKRALFLGPPTFRCKVSDCPFTTSAKSNNMLVKALRKHHKQTGHGALVRIPGSAGTSTEDEEFDVERLPPPGLRRKKREPAYPAANVWHPDHRLVGLDGQE